MEKLDCPQLSVIIVSWNVSGFLNHCLDSVIRACTDIQFEIIVVDNASTDGTAEMIKAKYPSVKLIENAENVGYSKANNQGIMFSRGRYTLFLNPDTILPRDALRLSIDYMEQNRLVGAMSLKLVDADGSFQAACRRSFPTPSTAFYRMTGLSSLFPRSKRFGKYNLTFLDEDETMAVDAICGAYMMVRHEILQHTGGFDESFFMYGEDIDLCWRIRKAGYEIIYHPIAEIIHFKGESSKKNRFRSALNFYNSMFIFSKKYFSEKMTFMPRSILFIGIFFNAIVKAPAEWFLRYFAIPVDLLIVNLVLLGFLSIKTGGAGNFYLNIDFKWTLLLHFCISSAYGLSLHFHGAYSGKPKSVVEYIRALAIATLLFFSLVYFIPYVRFSRAAFTATGVSLLALIPGWRFLFSRTALKLYSPIARKRRVLIVGCGDLAVSVHNRLLQDVDYHKGFVGFVNANVPDKKVEVPAKIIGTLDEIEALVSQHKITELVLATKERDNFDLVKLINYCGKNHINMKIVEGIAEKNRFYLLDVDLSENFVL